MQRRADSPMLDWVLVMRMLRSYLKGTYSTLKWSSGEVSDGYSYETQCDAYIIVPFGDW